MNEIRPSLPIDDVDRRLVAATQAGLPLVAMPYHAIAEKLDLEPSEVMARLRRMHECGIIRRVGAVPNHYRLGIVANGMTVWDVDDDAVADVGPAIGALDFVSHCYHRPRHLPLWPYNVFAMVHGRSRDEVEAKAEEIAGIVGDRCRGHAILYSTRILKKTGLRIAE